MWYVVLLVCFQMCTPLNFGSMDKCKMAAQELQKQHITALCVNRAKGDVYPHG